MREDSAEKSARLGLVDYAENVQLPDRKPCGCPLVGCTVECRRQTKVCGCPLAGCNNETHNFGIGKGKRLR